MLFQLYGSTCGTQLLGWLLVFCGLVLTNEIARRTKAGGYAIFIVLPAVLTVYFILANLGVISGTQTVTYMSGWFHYAKLYAATIGCIGFMLIKYQIGIGAKDWFRPWPWIIVSINILIAVASDFESAIAAYKITGDLSGAWWASNEGVFIYGGWWNVVNGIAGIINCFCMTGCWSIFSSKDKNHQDMIWADMTIWFIVAYDIWNFQYTYLNLPTHSWYCGVALLLAPTFANAFWNKGGWIQNRANTLSIWCMFAQVVPLFQLSKTFSVLPSVYGGAQAMGYCALDFFAPAMELYNAGLGKTAAVGEKMTELGITANPTMQGVISIAAIVANVICICAIIKRAKKLHVNPYTHDVWVGTKDFEEAMERVDTAKLAH